MKATVSYVQQKFKQFNDLMFGGLLKPIPVKLEDVSSTLGHCCNRIKTLPNGRKIKTDFELRINMRIDQTESELEDVIIHEMIHYFIGCHQLVDSSPHGYLFKAIMASINKAHGRHITISSTLNKEQMAQAADSRRKWHVIAVITMRDGTKWIKVLPRVLQRILDFHRAVSRQYGEKAVRLYLHDDPYFNRFPCSSALKIQKVDASELSTALLFAQLLSVRGNSVVNETVENFRNEFLE